MHLHLNKDSIVKIEAVVVSALQILMMLLVIAGTSVLFVILAIKLYHELFQVDSVDSFMPAMQRSFAGVLIVVLGLELLETLKTYFTDHHVRLEVILVVAIIAVSRHVIQIDFDHAPATVLFGLAVLLESLTFGYFLVKRI